MIKISGFSRASSKKLKYKSPCSPIGIDIGSARIKIIQLQQKAGTLSLAGLALASTPQGAISGGRIVDPDKLSYKLGRLKKKLILKGNRVNLCLGPETHYLRLLELPPLSKRDLQKALPWELEKHFPLKAKNAVFACCPLAGNKSAGNGTVKYILTAAEVESAAALTGAAEKAGFKALALEVSPLALLRVEALTPDGKPEIRGNFVKALLDIGYRSTTLLLVGKRTLQYCRILRIGILDFLKAASSAKDFNLTEAQRYIFMNDVLSTISTVKVAEQFAGQIAASIGHYLDQPGSGISEPDLISVSGGGAAIPGLIDFLQSRLSVKVELQQLPLLFSGKAENQSHSGQPLPAVYNTAFGLALRGWLR